MARPTTTKADTLRRSCQVYAQKYNYRPDDYARGFEGMVAHLFAAEEGFDSVLDGRNVSDADLSDFILRSNDFGVDVVLEDELNSRLILAQSKWCGRGVPEEEDIASFFDIHHRLQNPEFVRQGSPEAQQRLSDYREKVRDGYSVQLRFVTNASITEDSRLFAVMTSKNTAYEEAGASVTCELIGRAQLRERERAAESAATGFIPEVHFKVKDERLFEFEEPRHGLVCRISGNELVNLFRQHALALFALNIRLPMTAGSPINPQIVDTAITSSGDFFFFNNGVSAICSSFELEGNQVNAKRFQIINGAQTVGALNRARTVPNLFVLFRLTATDELSGGEFTEKIIRFNNTQNPIKDPDFRANDPIQTFLARELASRFSGRGPVPAFYYKAKRGQRAGGKGGKALNREDLASIRHAFLYGPVASFREPKSLWDNQREGKYWQAFGTEGQACKEWTDEEMAETVVAFVVTDRLKRTHEDLKSRAKKDGTEPPKETLYLKRLARYVAALVGVGLRDVKGAKFHTFQELLSSTTRFDEVVEPLEKVARTLVQDEFLQRMAAREEVRTEYNLARSEDTWERLKEKMRERIASGLV